MDKNDIKSMLNRELIELLSLVKAELEQRENAAKALADGKPDADE